MICERLNVNEDLSSIPHYFSGTLYTVFYTHAAENERLCKVQIPAKLLSVFGKQLALVF